MGPSERAANTCRRCGRAIEVDPALSVDVFEGMHWLCFHLEFEHSADPDVPCSDVSSCPWWRIAQYEQKLRALDVDPDAVRGEAIDRLTEMAPAPVTTKPPIVYVDVDDTLVRSVGTKRVPLPNVIRYVKSLFDAGAELYCWSTGGASYAEESAREVGLHEYFRAFLPKPQVLIDDQHPSDWRGLEHRHPFSCHGDRT